MNKKIILLTAIILGILITTWYSCESDPKETCQQDEICDGHMVTACCTDNECVYYYNGREYTEDDLDDLAVDLGCSSVIAAIDSESQEKALSEVIERLKDLMAKTRELKETGKK
ncbi:MAG: hypothetical protein JW894_06055 [Bacteroidales bacterium]|nr:hypothetical protein [Bacteroidales bacterium]